MIDHELQEELLAMVRKDLAVRERLTRDGSLFDGYHPEMEAVHLDNAHRLDEILREHGWPGRSRVGVGGAEAAWLVVQHAISLPHFQRRALIALREAVERGDAPAWQPAMLEDRISLFEGRPQRFGTHFDWGTGGELEPYPPIEDIEGVDERRRAVGLEPLSAELERQREEAAAVGEEPPADVAARREEIEAWARRTGWRR